MDLGVVRGYVSLGNLGQVCLELDWFEGQFDKVIPTLTGLQIC